jgi:hypothetical protein
MRNAGQRKGRRKGIVRSINSSVSLRCLDVTAGTRGSPLADVAV